MNESLTSLEQGIVAEVSRRGRDLLDDLRLHVALPTGMGNTAALDETRERLLARLSALGATIGIVKGETPPDWLFGREASSPVPPTAVASRLVPDPSLPRLLLSGHLDTVHDPSGPFRELVIREDGKSATGPGCVDMKGGLVVAVAALEVLEHLRVPVSWSFVLNSDEETGSYCSEGTLREQARLHDLGLVFEPALPGGELVVERLGSGQFMVEASGRAAHVGRDFASGVSAVTALGRCLLAIGSMSDPNRGRILNVGPIEGGNATNVVAARARAWGNARYPTRQVADEIGMLLGSLVQEGMPSVRLHTSLNRPAKPLTPQTERLALAARRAAEDLGQSLPFAKTGGVCDGNILQDAGLPTIDTLGVRGGGLHTTEEWIDLSSLVERCSLVALLLARLSSGRADVHRE